jgi:integrative and conjugative element protein (TIGR02256 family)
VSEAIVFQVRLPLTLIEVSPGAKDELEGYRQINDAGHEAGGVLLGTRRGPHFEIVEITGPQPQDLRGRFSFLRRAGPHRGIARQRWKASGKLLGYVGEWHTHPESIPNPSAVDRRGWNELFEEHLQPLVHVIVGIETIRCWYCDERGVLHAATMLPSAKS